MIQPILGRALLVGAVLACASVARAATPPGPAGAYSGSAACVDCHEDVAAAMERQIHGRIASFEVSGRAVGCESCHGPGAAHAVDGDPELVRRFGDAFEGADDVCLSCHATGSAAAFRASTHAAEGLSCTDCHAIHRDESWPLEGCRECHADVVASFQFPSRHPLRDGKMTCASCHDVHGANRALLVGGELTVNDSCYRCHQDKEGPFVFEHAPVQESCSTCHVPHGSVADNLLTVAQPALCLQCHELHFHAGYKASANEEVHVGGFLRENPWGVEGMTIAFTTNCTQCHSKVHGSDLPSQGVPSGGRGLVR